LRESRVGVDYDVIAIPKRAIWRGIFKQTLVQDPCNNKLMEQARLCEKRDVMMQGMVMTYEVRTSQEVWASKIQ
jgi:hypothetical protein